MLGVLHSTWMLVFPHRQKPCFFKVFPHDIISSGVCGHGGHLKHLRASLAVIISFVLPVPSLAHPRTILGRAAQNPLAHLFPSCLEVQLEERGFRLWCSFEAAAIIAVDRDLHRLRCCSAVASSRCLEMSNSSLPLKGARASLGLCRAKLAFLLHLPLFPLQRTRPCAAMPNRVTFRSI